MLLCTYSLTKSQRCLLQEDPPHKVHQLLRVYQPPFLLPTNMFLVHRVQLRIKPFKSYRYWGVNGFYFSRNMEQIVFLNQLQCLQQTKKKIKTKPLIHRLLIYTPAEHPSTVSGGMSISFFQRTLQKLNHSIVRKNNVIFLPNIFKWNLDV